jgi:hypothetical protein
MAHKVYSSYCQWAFCKALESNLLFPSNKLLTKLNDLGSLWNSIPHDNEIFNSKEMTHVQTVVHTLGKPFRAILRAVSLIFISSVIAPIGVLARLSPLYHEFTHWWNCPREPDWHAKELGKITFMAHGSKIPQNLSLLNTKRNRRAPQVPSAPLTDDQILKAARAAIQKEKAAHPTSQAWDRLQECALSVFFDSVATLVAWVGLYHISRLAVVPSPILRSFNLKMLEAWDDSLIKSCKYVAFFCAMFFFLGCNPVECLTWTTPPYRRAALYKTIQLKNVFGFVNQKGGFLSYDPVLDDENLQTKEKTHFRDIWIQQGFDILDQIYESQKLLGENPIPSHFPPQEKVILRHLNAIKAKSGISVATADRLVARFKTLFRNFDKMRALLQECLEMRESRYLLARFPFTEESCKSCFAKVTSQQEGDIAMAIQEAEGALCVDDNPHLKEEKLILYQLIKKAIRDKVTTDTRFKVLGLSSWPQTERGLKDQYKKCALVLHPDRAEESFKKEATALFKVVSAVYHLRLENITEKKPNEQPRTSNDPLAIKL